MPERQWLSPGGPLLGLVYGVVSPASGLRGGVAVSLASPAAGSSFWRASACTIRRAPRSCVRTVHGMREWLVSPSRGTSQPGAHARYVRYHPSRVHGGHLCSRDRSQPAGLPAPELGGAVVPGTLPRWLVGLAGVRGPTEQATSTLLRDAPLRDRRMENTVSGRQDRLEGAGIKVKLHSRSEKQINSRNRRGEVNRAVTCQEKTLRRRQGTQVALKNKKKRRAQPTLRKKQKLARWAWGLIEPHST